MATGGVTAVSNIPLNNSKHISSSISKHEFRPVTSKWHIPEEVPIPAPPPTKSVPCVDLSTHLLKNYNVSKHSIGWNLIKYGSVQVVKPKGLKQKPKRSQYADEDNDISPHPFNNRFSRLHHQREHEVEATHFLRCGLDSDKPQPQKLCGIISKICPPREYFNRGQLLRQYASCSVPTLKDVLSLKEKADLEFRALQGVVAEDGICTARRILNGKIFDELIRQITMAGIERGQLLIKIRNELYYQFKCHEKIYFSSLASTTRKLLLSQKRCSDLREKIRHEKHVIAGLEQVTGEYPEAIKAFQRKCTEERAGDDQVFYEEFEKADEIHQTLKDLLSNVIKGTRESEGEENMI